MYMISTVMCTPTESVKDVRENSKLFRFSDYLIFTVNIRWQHITLVQRHLWILKLLTHTGSEYFNIKTIYLAHTTM